MPIYEYQCSHCHHQFERIQKVTDAPVTHCDACGRDTVTRLVSAAGFQLKGTGWYATDFKDKPSTKPKADSSTTETTTAKSAEKTSDAPTTSSSSTTHTDD